MNNRIQVVIFSNILPKKIIHIDKDTTFSQLSNKITSNIQITENIFNFLKCKILGCLYKLSDNHKKKLLAIYEDYYLDKTKNIHQNIETFIDNDNKLNCYLILVDNSEYNDFFREDKDNINEFVDIDLDSDNERTPINIYYKKNINSSKIILDRYDYRWIN